MKTPRKTQVLAVAIFCLFFTTIPARADSFFGTFAGFLRNHGHPAANTDTQDSSSQTVSAASTTTPQTSSSINLAPRPAPVPAPASPSPSPLVDHPNACTPLGPQRIAVILATYPGAPADSGVANAHYIQSLFTGPHQGLSPEDYTDPKLLDSVQSVAAGNEFNFSIADYYKTVSSGKAWFESVKVVGPYESTPFVSKNDTIGNYYRSLDAWKEHLLSLAAHDLDLMNVDRIVFISPEAIDDNGKPVQYGGGMAEQGGCSLEYSGTQGHRTFASAWVHSLPTFKGFDNTQIYGSVDPSEFTSAQIKRQLLSKLKIDMEPITHELGHTFGLGHANAVQRPEKELTVQEFNDETLPAANAPLIVENYGDRYSVMANSNFRWLNVPHLRSLGWLDPAQVPVVTSNGTFRIYPIDNSSADPTQLRGIQIPRALQNPNEKTEAYLWVEYRQGTAPYDQDANSSLSLNVDGAIVHYTNPEQKTDGESSVYGSTGTTILLNFAPSGPVSLFQRDFTLKGTWKDPHSMVRLQVIQITPDYLDIQVSFDSN